MQRFGEKLRALRLRQGLTIRELASALGYSAHAHIGLVETGRRKPTADLIARVTHYFSVSAHRLIRDELEVE